MVRTRLNSTWLGAAKRQKLKRALQVLDQQALARLSNLEAVKPEKARQVQGMIIQMAR